MKNQHKKTIIHMFFCFVFWIAMLSPFTAIAARSPVRMGDLNFDGKISSVDARIAIRASAKLESMNEEQQQASDVNFDGKTNSIDARQILRVAAKLGGFEITVAMSTNQEYVIDSMFTLGKYSWEYTVEPVDGLEIDKIVHDPMTGTYENYEVFYIIKPKKEGVFFLKCKLGESWNNHLLPIEERTYTFIVDH
ncbi:MAG: dockerin type I repeat-containing protein [Clostridia bacterium]|nr:dockerin type I repeat-containing protein [Clostridia bacterium]